MLVREPGDVAGCPQGKCGLSVQDVSVVGVPSSEDPHEVGKYPIAGTLAPPLLMHAFAPFGPIHTYGLTFPSLAPSLCAVIRGPYILSILHYEGGIVAYRLGKVMRKWCVRSVERRKQAAGLQQKYVRTVLLVRESR